MGSSQPSHFVKKQDLESLSCLYTSLESSRLLGEVDTLKVSRLESDADGSVGRAFAGSGKQVESLQAISSFWVQ